MFLFSSNLSNSSVVRQYVFMSLLIISAITKPVTTLHIVVVYNHNFSMFVVHIFPQIYTQLHKCNILCNVFYYCTLSIDYHM